MSLLGRIGNAIRNWDKDTVVDPQGDVQHVESALVNGKKGAEDLVEVTYGAGGAYLAGLNFAATASLWTFGLGAVPGFIIGAASYGTFVGLSPQGLAHTSAKATKNLTDAGLHAAVAGAKNLLS